MSSSTWAQTCGIKFVKWKFCCYTFCNGFVFSLILHIFIYLDCFYLDARGYCSSIRNDSGRSLG